MPNDLNIWKVSQSPRFFTDQENEDLFNRHCVCVHPDTSAKGKSSISQGEDFCNVKRGDYFYLCYGNNCIRLFGVFIGESQPCRLQGKEDWLEQKYDLLFESKSNQKYQGSGGWWTPKDNSTFTKVNNNENFEKWILLPFFSRTINEIKYFEKMKTYALLLVNNHNLILTGAPGTGKTYLAKQIAKEMGCDEKHIKLVQFHPSYDYTDFVEGLRPIKQGGTLGFQRKDGVFKEFCKKAIQVQLNASFEKLYESIVDDIANGTITTYTTLSNNVYSLKVDKGVIKYGCQNNGNDFKSESVDNIKLIYEHFLVHPKDIDYSTNGLRGLIDKLTDGKISTLDPSEYSWTIKELLSRRNKLLSQKYVFIIDEINRGEISKIFGELFYSIDPGYRGEKGRVDTQYQNLIPKEGDDDYDPNKADVFRNGFYVPDNVYIIGTMNDIDRSVESMDFAMRRRFAWKEITAKSRQSMLDENDAWKPYAKPGQNIIDEIKNRMDNLNACIIDQYNSASSETKDKIGLTKAYQIGASYFLKYGLYNNFDDLWNNHLDGLLREYLRGTTKIDDKITRLKEAYNDTTAH